MVEPITQLKILLLNIDVIVPSFALEMEFVIIMEIVLVIHFGMELLVMNPIVVNMTNVTTEEHARWNLDGINLNVIAVMDTLDLLA